METLWLDQLALRAGYGERTWHDRKPGARSAQDREEGESERTLNVNAVRGAEKTPAVSYTTTCDERSIPNLAAHAISSPPLVSPLLSHNTHQQTSRP